ncbi:MAG: hypothetical protein J6R31_03605, partial [Rikenellaceae bacterium]|nr:hypothetical protein [Rikenellaceae bacterium]
YTTWYGQVVVINKVIDIDWTTYNYAHVPEFVYNNDGVYFSNPIVKYTNKPAASNLLESIQISLDMNTAFNVVNEKGKIIKLLDLAGYGLTSKFDFVKDPVDTGIQFPLGGNNLYYHGKDEQVYVKASLVLKNSNGVETVLPTNFDEGQIYDGYYVVKLNPVGMLKKENLDIKLSTIAKEYTYFINNQLKLADQGEGRGYNLIARGDLTEDAQQVTYTPASWVVGNDNNGFANGESVADIYGLKFVSYECTGIPETIEDVLKFNNLTGELYFDNMNQIELTGPITLTVRVKVTHTWADEEVTFPVTIGY